MPTILRITRLPNRHVELSWASEAAFKYHVQRSTDLKTWTDYAGPYDGERDTVLKLAIPSGDIDAFFRLLVSVPDKTFITTTAITALDGSHVVIQWQDVLANNERFEIFRNTDSLGYVPGTVTSYKDTTVNSGRTYIYDVRIRK